MLQFTVPIGQSTPDTAVDGVEVVPQPARMVARTRHRGDYHGIGAAYRAIDEWIGTSGYRAAGPPSEVYLVGPEQTADIHDLITEIRIPVIPALALAVRLVVSFPEAVAAVRHALRDQGFGVLTEINLRATMREKLDEETEDYVILGVCNPPLAHQALRVDRQVGLLLPCTVVVRAEGDHTLVEALDPDVLVRATDLPALRPIAAEARGRLAAALAALREPIGRRGFDEGP